MNFLEFFLFIKKLTPKKCYNFLLRIIMKIITRLTKKIVFLGKPWSISIEPCNICNLKCRECPSGLGQLGREKKQLSYKDFCLAIDQIYSHTLNLFLYFQGEPFINQHFTQMVKYASEKNIYTVTSTNGHFITPEIAEEIVLSKLDKIIISLDGYNQQTYQAYRTGGNYINVILSIKNIVEAKEYLNKKTPVVEVQTLANKLTENKLEEIKKIAKYHGVNKFAVKTMQIENPKDFEKFLPTNQKLSRYKKTSNGQYVLKKEVGFCNRIFDSVVITSNLDIVPCCYDKKAEYILGNLSQNTFNEIVTNQKAKQFITNIINKNRPKICYNCGG